MRLINEMGYDKNMVRGWFWDAELLIRAQKRNYKIVVIPVKWVCGEKSSFNLKRELKAIPYLIKLKTKIK